MVFCREKIRLVPMKLSLGIECSVVGGLPSIELTTYPYVFILIE